MEEEMEEDVDPSMEPDVDKEIEEWIQCDQGEFGKWTRMFLFIARGKVRGKENTYRWVSV